MASTAGGSEGVHFAVYPALPPFEIKQNRLGVVKEGGDNGGATNSFIKLDEHSVPSSQAGLMGHSGFCLFVTGIQEVVSPAGFRLGCRSSLRGCEPIRSPPRGPKEFSKGCEPIGFPPWMPKKFERL